MDIEFHNETCVYACVYLHPTGLEAHKVQHSTLKIAFFFFAKANSRTRLKDRKTDTVEFAK